MWFIFITAHLFIFPSFQPRLAATLLGSCSVVNNLTRRTGLSPAFQPTSLAQPVTVRAEHKDFELVQTSTGRSGWVGRADLSRVVPQSSDRSQPPNRT